MTTEHQLQLQAPDPALRNLDRLVGAWSLRGHLVGSDVENILGEARFAWLPGGFFMQQDVTIDFLGVVHIQSHELIGYDPATRTFPSRVYSNLSPEPLPYVWGVEADSITIRVTYGILNATFSGTFTAEGFTGGWRPNRGADETANVAYDLVATRLG